MEAHILLGKLRALLERAPDLYGYSAGSREYHTWLGQAHALVSRWNSYEAGMFKVACDHLSSPAMLNNNVATIMGTLHRAIADLEIQVPADAEVSFGAGDVYDFFKALNKVIASAEKSIFIVDPYLDNSVFDHYLTSRQPNVHVRLLVSHKAEALIPYAEKYNAQHDGVLELRKSKSLHDRVIFVDDYVCWIIGQSIKHAAKAKPTYLVQIPPDIVPEKLHNYEEIWASAIKL